MNESSKVTIYYNKLFKQNHEQLLGRIIKLWKENKVNLKNMEEEFITKENVKHFIDCTNDLEEVIQRLKWDMVADETMSVLNYLLRSCPSSILVSCVATWKVGEKNYQATTKKEIENIVNRIEDGTW